MSCYRKSLIYTLIILLLTPFTAFSFSIKFPEEIKQGEIALISVKGVKSVEGEFLGSNIIFFKDKNGVFKAFIASDILTAEGEKVLTLKGKKSNRKAFSTKRRITVKNGGFLVEQLIIEGKTEKPDEDDLIRISREAMILKELWGSSSKEKLFKGEFILPVKDGKISPNFGFKRVINGVEKSPHSGIDIKSREGTEVLAINDGIVMLADNLFFPGNSVIVDHGAGLISMYFHLSEMSVNAGEKVKKGEVIGKVGMTGRATGPHLHLGLRLGNFRINPENLINFQLK